MQAECRYTKMIANLLDGIEIRLNTDYLAHKVELDAIAEKVVYTGPIDAYFGYKLGTLEYRSVRFETETLDEGRNRANGTHPGEFAVYGPVQIRRGLCIPGGKV